MNACGFVFQARCRLNSYANSVEFPPVCTHSDSILPQPVRNAAMTMILMPPLCTVARDGGSRPHPLGMPSRILLGDLFLFLPHGVTVHEISPPA